MQSFPIKMLKAFLFVPMHATRHFHLSDLIFLMFFFFFGGNRDSVVSIAIRYKLDGPAFESQHRQDIFSPPITRKEISP